MGIDDDVDVIMGQRRNEIESQLIRVRIPYWKKGMKISCPECNRNVPAPYKCKCGAVLKPYVKMNV